MYNFNKNHPEKREDEKWIGNFDIQGYRGLCWETKRKGKTAYTANGEIVCGFFPVFIKITDGIQERNK